MAENECNKEYAPVVKLEPVEVDSGETEETEIYTQRCKLYRYYAPTPEWKERGLGDVRMLKHNESNIIRVLLREEKTMKLRMNHFVHPDVELRANQGSDRSWTWACTDYASGEAVQETFAIRFKNEEIAKAFKDEHDKARAANKATAAAAEGGAAPAAAADADAKPEAKAEEAEAKEEADSGTNLWIEILNKNKFDPLSEEDMKKLWTEFDKDESGAIEASELESLMQKLLDAISKHLDAPLPAKICEELQGKLPELVKEALGALDKNHDGKITWDEFVSLNTIKVAM